MGRICSKPPKAISSTEFPTFFKMSDANEQRIERLKKRRGDSLENVHSKSTKSIEKDLIEIARTMWRRDPKKERSTNTEDRDFREFFGCSLFVSGVVWETLVKNDEIPHNGCLNHLLWALMFMKVYGKERTLCSLAGGVDKKTYRKWSWKFAIAIANLSPSVVRNYYTYISCF